MTAACGEQPVLPALRTPQPCQIYSEVRKRNGDPLYFCWTHGEEVTVRRGGDVPGSCRGAAAPEVPHDGVLVLDLDELDGGAAAWGATPPVISFGEILVEAGGVHVHVRRTGSDSKEIDASYTILIVRAGGIQVELDEESARAYLVTAVTGHDNVVLACPHCGWIHLDRGRFAVDPHRKHLCNRCHRNFWAKDLTISNPAAQVHQLPGVGAPPPPIPASDRVDLRRDRVGGFAIWASNPAVFWTFDRPEVEGIHVHAWGADGRTVHDETFGTVTIDGVLIDAEQLRLLMAQRVVIDQSRIVTLHCRRCAMPVVDRGFDAMHPANEKSCIGCSAHFATPGRRRVVSNPLVELLQQLGLQRRPTGRR